MATPTNQTITLASLDTEVKATGVADGSVQCRIDPSVFSVGDAIVVQEYIKLSSGGAWKKRGAPVRWSFLTAVPDMIEMPAGLIGYEYTVGILQVTGTTLRTTPIPVHFVQG